MKQPRAKRPALRVVGDGEEPNESPAEDSHARGVFEVRLRDEGARAFAVYDLWELLDPPAIRLL